MALYPPYIEGTIPALQRGKDLTIPFVMNKTVGWNEIKGFGIKIKNIQNNEVITTAKTYNNTNDYPGYSKDKQIAYFSVDESKFTIGSSYKLQMAYIDQNNNYGHYSTVGVFKYTAEPYVYIDGLEGSQLHSDTRTYIGVYSQEGKDVTEKVYSYNFTVYDEQGKVLETSGEQLHNHENDDVVYKSTDSFTMIKSLEENKIYTIIYTVTTANGVIKSSSKYRITQQSTIAPEVEANLIATMNEENGYVNLQLIGKKDKDGIEKVGTGTFLICRASSEDNYGSWSEIDRFALFGEVPSSHNWKDFTVQHGFTYIYSLQQYNKEYQIYSNRMLSNEIIANFEHSFLYDGKRQLKIKYNPKVTSFKETLLEQKTNTLGGKYPFFFRNGNVRYKEFPISGLISYLSDEEELFLTNNDLLLEDLNGLVREHTLKEGIKSTDYDYFNNMLDANQAYKLQNEYAKRENVNSQENQIARKKDRTTNLTDYNIVAERIFKMKVLDFLNDGKPKLFRSPGEGNYIVRLMNSSLSPDDKLSRMIHTFSTTATEIDDFNYQKLNEYNLISAQEPDTKQLRWKTVNIRELINANGGINGNKWISIGGENNIMSIQFIDMIPGDSFRVEFAAGGQDPLEIQIGTTGAYYIEFDEAARQVFIDRKSRQGQVTYSYYGTSLHHFDTYRYIKMDDIPIVQLTEATENQDIREYYGLEDIKHRITKYYFLNFTKQYNAPVDSNFKFWIDEKEIDISETDDFQLIKPEYIPEIRLGSGVCLDISIQRREIEYDVEENDADVKAAKEIYLEAYNEVQDWIKYICYNNNNEININEINTFDLDKFLETEEKKGNNYELPKTPNYEAKLYDTKDEEGNITNYGLISNMKQKYDKFIEQLERALKEKEVLAE